VWIVEKGNTTPKTNGEKRYEEAEPYSSLAIHPSPRIYGPFFKAFKGSHKCQGLESATLMMKSASNSPRQR
jgi:hypothetical protein